MIPSLATFRPFVNFTQQLLGLNAALIRYPEIEVWRRKRRQTHPAIREILTKINWKIHMLIDVFFGVSVPTAKGPYSESELTSISQTILSYKFNLKGQSSPPVILCCLNRKESTLPLPSTPEVYPYSW